MDHIPVLLEEVSDYLKPEPNKLFIDGTVGLGGHAYALMSRALPGSRLLGIDRDDSNLAIAKERLASFGESVVLVHDSYANVKKYAYDLGFTSAGAILLDLGFSSVHVDDPLRGFSFASDGPLDMRYDRSRGLTAETIINDWTIEELARIFRQFGEELQAQRIAVAIARAREEHRISTTVELAKVIESVVKRHGKIHPATKVFQALRIAVNDELGELARALPDLVDLLAPDGRIAIITFHSLEDRLVKRFFNARNDLQVLTKRVVVASQEEVRKNRRARSAKLRVASRL
jgi:16S rRNA (cytosine1402-N4)-methyltransferase